MLEDVVRRINLIDHLEQQYPDVPPPPEEAAETWSEAQIRAYYLRLHGQPASPTAIATGAVDNAHQSRRQVASGIPGDSEAPEEDACPDQPGGGRVQPDQPHLDPASAPPTLRQHQLTATVAGYRAAAIAHGIPFRWASLVVAVLPAAACDHDINTLLYTTFQCTRSSTIVRECRDMQASWAVPTRRCAADGAHTAGRQPRLREAHGRGTKQLPGAARWRLDHRRRRVPRWLRLAHVLPVGGLPAVQWSDCDNGT